MKAILRFRDYKGNNLLSGISQGQNEGSHKNLNGANDFMGTSANDWVDLLAPYDCKVMAISRVDNAVFFQSVGAVETPIGTFGSCWFMTIHTNDTDFNKLGIAVGKKFVQGQPVATEGKKGIGDGGKHIHLEQGTGIFGGGSMPYYKSTDTYRFNGITYYQYYPNYKNGWEYPVYDMFFVDPNDKQYYSSYEYGQSRYKGKWVYLSDNSAVTGDKEIDKLKLELKEKENLIKELQGKNTTLTNCLDEIKKKIEGVL